MNYQVGGIESLAGSNLSLIGLSLEPGGRIIFPRTRPLQEVDNLGLI